MLAFDVDVEGDAEYKETHLGILTAHDANGDPWLVDLVSFEAESYMSYDVSQRCSRDCFLMLFCW